MAQNIGRQRYQSWGRFPAARHTRVIQVQWREGQIDLGAPGEHVLPYGYGRSYGDSCLNNGGALLDCSPLRRFIAFDAENGLLRCEAGVSLAEVLALIVPHGWFLPVTPGTKFVSIGGAIANDVHGKNHHVAGTFGCHVTRFELLRSDGERLECSPAQNCELFQATIGGLGLTGLITWAEFRLRAIPGPYIAKETVRFGSLDEFFEVSAESDESHEFTMSWVDCLARGNALGRGLFMRGNFAWPRRLPRKPAEPQQRLQMPFDLPGFALNTLTVRAFNTAMYHKQLARTVRQTVPFDPFFYPLDAIQDWYRLYGRRGFLQYQFVVPYQSDKRAIRSILETISASGEGSFLAVLKTFGEVQSPGMLSFPRPGVTLALDFAQRGKRTFRLLDRLDEIVLASGGAVYPAKDARMSAASFQAYFPAWREFSRYVDPKFSSSFWRRVTKG
jgi:FAD/FMN-containing dehydrogenase